MGHTDVASGLLDGVKYNVFAMKEEDYTMKLMSTYGTLTPSPNQEEVIRRVRNLDGTFSNKKIKYCHPIGYHFHYRHAVDDHNNLRHSSPSLEGVWRTHRWEMRVFSFLLAVTEVNAFLACRFFIWNKRTKKIQLYTNFENN